MKNIDGATLLLRGDDTHKIGFKRIYNISHFEHLLEQIIDVKSLSLDIYGTDNDREYF